jgi:hypothetical protein
MELLMHRAKQMHCHFHWERNKGNLLQVEDTIIDGNWNNELKKMGIIIIKETCSKGKHSHHKNNQLVFFYNFVKKADYESFTKRMTEPIFTTNKKGKYNLFFNPTFS